MTLIELFIVIIIISINYAAINCFVTVESTLMHLLYAILLYIAEVVFLGKIYPLIKLRIRGLPFKWIYRVYHPQKRKQFPKNPKQLILYLTHLNSIKWYKQNTFEEHKSFEKMSEDNFIKLLSDFAKISKNIRFLKEKRCSDSQLHYLNTICQLHLFADVSKIDKNLIRPLVNQLLDFIKEEYINTSGIVFKEKYPNNSYTAKYKAAAIYVLNYLSIFNGLKLDKEDLVFIKKIFNTYTCNNKYTDSNETLFYLSFFEKDE